MTKTLQKQDFEIAIIKPVYGVNYNKGYIGFTYDGNHPIGQGIAYFTKWHKISNIYATHALIVTGKNLCIEADATKNRILENDLDHYFNHETCQIFFRKPRNLNDDIANRIVSILKSEVGKEYDFKLILAHALTGTFLGQWFNRLSQNKLEEILGQSLNHPNQWICSELAAYALDEQPEYRDKGILKHPNATICPQELFEDPEEEKIFEPWKQDITDKLKNLLIK